MSDPFQPEETESPSALPSRRPASRGWYFLALLVMALGIAAFLLSLRAAQRDVAQRLAQMHRFVMPGQVSVELDRPGRYLVYYEKQGEFRGETFDTHRRFSELPRLDVDIRHDASETYLTVHRAVDATSQIYRGGQANSEFYFDVPADLAPGRFTVAANHENAQLEDRLLLAVGPPIVGDMMSSWQGPFGGAAALAFSFVLAAVLVLLTWTLRHGDVTRRGS